MTVVDLKERFDRVPREVVLWALSYAEFIGWKDACLSAIKSSHEDATTKVRVNGSRREKERKRESEREREKESKAFSVGTGCISRFCPQSAVIRQFAGCFV